MLCTLLRLSVKPKKQPPQAFVETASAFLRPFEEVVIEASEDSVQLKGCEESQIELAVVALKKHFGEDLLFGNLSVEYLETVTETIEREGKIVFTDPQDYAQVWLRITPGARGSGVGFVSVASKEAVPEQFIPVIEAGVRDALICGPIAGYQVTDVQVLLIDGSYHSDSTSRSFKTAALIACKEGLANCAPVLLEPIMSVEVSVLETQMGEVIGDLAGRRGLITNLSETSPMVQIGAQVPLAKLLGYRAYLETGALGEATCSIKFSHYDKAPGLSGPDDDEPASMALKVA